MKVKGSSCCIYKSSSDDSFISFNTCCAINMTSVLLSHLNDTAHVLFHTSQDRVLVPPFNTSLYHESLDYVSAIKKKILNNIL